MNKNVYFGDCLVNVLEKLGNPNKEYHKGGYLYLNYFELGLDIVIENKDYSVKKMVVCANNLNMPDFCFHDRCSFELLITRTVEIKP